MAEAPEAQVVRERVGLVSLLCAGLMLAWEGLLFATYLGYGEAVVMRYADSSSDLLTAGLLLALWGLSRLRRVGDAAFVRVSRAALVVICASSSTISTMNAHAVGGRPPFLTWVALLIAVFPLIVPTPPCVALGYALAAAATAPASSVALAGLGVISGPPLDHAAVSVGPLAAAGIAALGARVLHGVSVGAEELRHELRRQEIAAWKRLIRVLSHELNNSLAPSLSLLRSAQLVLEKPEHLHRLGPMLETVRGRMAHLQGFLDRYAELSRLPAPRPEEVAWDAFLAELGPLCPLRPRGDTAGLRGWFDVGQMQQVLINLAKNAAEAGSPPEEITVEARAHEGGLLIEVRDRGQGLSAEALSRAMVPFYSTRRGGTGLGLTLCREIVEAHGGRIAIGARAGGGAELSLWLPGPPASGTAGAARQVSAAGQVSGE